MSCGSHTTRLARAADRRMPHAHMPAQAKATAPGTCVSTYRLTFPQ